MIVDDDFFKYVFATRNSEARGIGIPVVLLNKDIMQTNAYKVYDVDFKKKKKEQVSRESSVTRIPLKLKIKKRQSDLETPIPTAEQAEARDNVKLVERHIMDEDVNKLVEGDDFTAVEFADSLIISQEDANTRIDPGSHKERPKAMNVKDHNVVVEEEESAEEALI
ncbi:hypothetical protein Tco_0179682 [Tanacetum coccineum]